MTSSSWSKSGKTWIGTGPLRSFLTLNIQHKNDLSDLEVVELEVIERSVKPAMEWVKPETLLKVLKT
jgi:hypothetical protein